MRRSSGAACSPSTNESRSAISGSPRTRSAPPPGRRSSVARRTSGRPSRCDGEKTIGPEADVFGATGVLWNLLTGEVPGGAGDMEAQLATVPTAGDQFLRVGSRPSPSAASRAWPNGRLPRSRRSPTTRDRAASGSMRSHPVRRARTRDSPRSSHRMPRSSSAAKRSSTSWSRGCSASNVLVIGGPSGSGKSSLFGPASSRRSRRRAAGEPALARRCCSTPGPIRSKRWPNSSRASFPSDPRSTPANSRADPRAARRCLASEQPVLIGDRPVRRDLHSRRRPGASDAFLDVLATLTDESRCAAPYRHRAPLRLLLGVRALSVARGSHQRQPGAGRSDATGRVATCDRGARATCRASARGRD